MNSLSFDLHYYYRCNLTCAHVVGPHGQMMSLFA